MLKKQKWEKCVKDKDVKKFLHPELEKDFQYKNGVIIKDPHTVELNPGGVYEADPTVDLGMIYPYQTRQKVILQKNGYQFPPKLKKLPKKKTPQGDSKK